MLVSPPLTRRASAYGNRCDALCSDQCKFLFHQIFLFLFHTAHSTQSVTGAPRRRSPHVMLLPCSGSSAYVQSASPFHTPQSSSTPHAAGRARPTTAPPAPPFLPLVRSQLKNKDPHIPTFSARYTLVRLQQLQLKGAFPCTALRIEAFPSSSREL